MSNPSNALPFVAFFTNDVSNIINPELEIKIKSRIEEMLTNGELDANIPVAITLQEDESFTIENKHLEEPADLKVEPGLISLPENYNDTSRQSLAADPIYAKHMESVWGF